MITVSPLARALVRRRVEAQMLATITILRGALGTLNPTTGLVGGLASAVTVYTGKARIRSVTGSGVIDVGGGEIDQRSTVISIPIAATAPRRDDLVVIGQDDAADAELDTRIFRVMEVDGGGYFGECTHLNCTGWYSNRLWGAQ